MKQHFPASLSRRFTLLVWCFCISLMVSAQAGRPAVISSSPQTADDYLYFDLVCNVSPFSGYFDPVRWQRNEDHAFQVSNVITDGETAREMTGIVFSGPRTVSESWSIEIPASGYLSFKINPIPTGATSPDFIRINQENVPYQVRADGLYYSPFLQKGDRFTITIPPGNDLFHWSDLTFHSNFSAVIVKPSAPSAERRYVPIEAGKIQRVFFPDNSAGTWPVFDQDGDRSTTFDQIELRSSTDVFDVEYVDKQVFVDGAYRLQRTFTIKEKCRRANRMKRRREWSELPLIVTKEWQK